MSWTSAHRMGRLGRWTMLLGIIGLLVVFGLSFYVASLNSTYYSDAAGLNGTVSAGSDAANAFRLTQYYTPILTALQFLGIGLVVAGFALQIVPIVAMLAVQGTSLRDAFAGPIHGRAVRREVPPEERKAA